MSSRHSDRLARSEYCVARREIRRGVAMAPLTANRSTPLEKGRYRMRFSHLVHVRRSESVIEDGKLIAREQARALRSRISVTESIAEGPPPLQRGNDYGLANTVPLVESLNVYLSRPDRVAPRGRGVVRCLAESDRIAAPWPRGRMR